MVNNCYAEGKLQALLELCEENYPREQSRNSDRNPDWGSSDEVSGRWESVGDDGADGDERVGNFGSGVRNQESCTTPLNFRPLLNIKVICPVRCVVIKG